MTYLTVETWAKAQNILNCNSAARGEAWWSSDTKRNLEWFLALGLGANPLTTLLLIGCMAGIYSQDFAHPLVQISVPHPHYGPRKKLKLRTMIEGAEELESEARRDRSLDELRESGEDWRITPFGQNLRHLSLDELPQFWSILAGDPATAIVGPRGPSHSQLREEIYPNQNQLPYRDYLKALGSGLRYGITSLPIVCDRHLDIEGRVAIDAEYAKNASLISDLRIIFLTANLNTIANGV